MDLVDRLKIQPAASQFLRTGDLVQSLIAEREEAAERIERLQQTLRELEWQQIEIGRWDSTWNFRSPTHWMPLPELPQ